MTTKQFKVFKQYVEEANETSAIWWAGYYWIDLTTRQVEIINKVLENKAFIKQVVDCKGRTANELPSGLTIATQK